MENVYCLLRVYIMLLSAVQVVIGELCSFPSDPCTCQTSTFVLNLKPLMDAMGGVDFRAVGENGEYGYYMQPCNRRLSSQLSGCDFMSTSLVCCQVYEFSPSLAYGLGIIGNFDATRSGDDFILTNSYSDIYDLKERKMQLTIRCSDQEATFIYDGNNNPFFVLLIVYLAGGALFQKFVRKANGTEIIPNVAFWAVIPSLIKDGAMFLFHGCKGHLTQRII